MELVVLVIIAALLFFGPRKGWRMPSMLSIGLGLFFIMWFLVVMGFGTFWNHFFGSISKP